MLLLDISTSGSFRGGEDDTHRVFHIRNLRGALDQSSNVVGSESGEKEKVIKPYYQDEHATIHHGDCRQILPELDAASIDLTVTSPPYDDLRTYEGFSWDYKTTADELLRVSTPGAVVVWVVADQTVSGSESGNSFRHALYFQSIGFNIHDTMIYEKSGVTYPDTARYYSGYELK